MECKVLNLYVYPSFAELYRHHDKVSMGYDEDDTADPDDMLMYYSAEDIHRYGVVGIEVELC